MKVIDKIIKKRERKKEMLCLVCEIYSLLSAYIKVLIWFKFSKNCKCFIKCFIFLKEEEEEEKNQKKLILTIQ